MAPDRHGRECLPPRPALLTCQLNSLAFGFYSRRDLLNLSVKRIHQTRTFDDLGHPVPGGLHDESLGPQSDSDICQTCGEVGSLCAGHSGHMELPLPVFNPITFQLVLMPSWHCANCTQLVRGSCVHCHRLGCGVDSAPARLLLAQLRCMQLGLFAAVERIEANFAAAASEFRVSVDSGATVISQPNVQVPDTEEEQMRETDELICKLLGWTLEQLRAGGPAAATTRQSDNFFTSTDPDADPYKLDATETQEGTGASWQSAKTEVKQGDVAKAAQMAAQTYDDDTVGIEVQVGELSVGRLTQVVWRASECRDHIRLLWANDGAFLEQLYPFFQGFKPSCELDTGQTGRGLSVRRECAGDVLFMDLVHVMPTRYRPVRMMAGQLYEHPRTAQLRRVLEEAELVKGVTMLLKGNQAAELKDLVDRRLPGKWDYAYKLHQAYLNLQARLNVLFDQESNKVLGEKAPGVRQILEKKEGMFRKHMMGKRVNFACRSVITPDPYLCIDQHQVGVPAVFARRLTVSEPVNERNLARLRKLVDRGPNGYPGANFVTAPNGAQYAINLKSSASGSVQKGPQNRNTADADRLQPPDPLKPWQGARTVQRHLQAGDILLMNRQPTLHKPSIMGHRARLLPKQNALRMNYAPCKAYNADFDGDEMNGHLLQDILSRTEAHELASCKQNYLVPKDGTPILGLIQDHVVSGVLLSMRDKFFTRAQIQFLVLNSFDETMHGFSLGVKDILVTDEGNKMRRKVIKKLRKCGRQAALKALTLPSDTSDSDLSKHVCTAYNGVQCDGGDVKQLDLEMKKATDVYAEKISKGLIDTAVKTSRSGYLQRCIIKHLEALQVSYDRTVRDCDNSVIQFRYGEDGLEVGKAQFLSPKLFPVLLDNQRLLEKYECAASEAKLSAANWSDDTKKVDMHFAQIEEHRARVPQSGRLTRAEYTSGFLGWLSHDGLQYKSDPKFTTQSAVAAWHALDAGTRLDFERRFNDHAPMPVDELFDPRRQLGALPESLLTHINTWTRELRILRGKRAAKRMKKQLYLKGLLSLAPGGECVGALAAQSVGEPSTQMTLNTFHFAGRGEMNVTLGIPRLREILMTASRTLATPMATVPVAPGVPWARHRSYTVRLELSAPADRERRAAHLNPSSLLRLVEAGLVKRLSTVLSRRLEAVRTQRDMTHGKMRLAAEQGATARRTADADPDANVDDSDKNRDGDKKGADNVAVEDDEALMRDEAAMSSDDEGGDVGVMDAESALRRRRHDDTAREYEGEEQDAPDADAQANNDDEYSDTEERPAGDEPNAAAKSDEPLFGEDNDKNTVSVQTSAARIQNVLRQSPFCVSYAYDADSSRWCEFTLQINLHRSKLDVCSIIRTEMEAFPVQAVPNVLRCVARDDGRGGCALQTQGINLCALFGHGQQLLVDKVYTNDVHHVRDTYGIEAAARALVNEITNVFGCYGIEVNARHLTLVADYMTFTGAYCPFNRGYMATAPSPLQQMSFETTTNFMRHALYSGTKDTLSSPSANIVVGKPFRSGTNAFDLLTKMSQTDLAPSQSADAATRLNQWLRNTTGTGKSDTVREKGKRRKGGKREVEND